MLYKKFILNIIVTLGVCSSVVERYVDIVEAISSILIMPTINLTSRLRFLTIDGGPGFVFQCLTLNLCPQKYPGQISLLFPC